MRNKFILLNGHPGSGKSTVAHEIAQRVPKIAVLDIDMFRKFVFDYGFSKKDIELGWKVAFAVMEVYLSNGVSVLADRCVPENAPRLKMKQLAKKFKAEYFEVILYTSTSDCAIKRVQARPIKQLSRFKKIIDKPRIKTLRTALLSEIHKPDIISFDTEKIPLEKVVDSIVKLF